MAQFELTQRRNKLGFFRTVFDRFECSDRLYFHIKIIVSMLKSPLLIFKRKINCPNNKFHALLSLVDDKSFSFILGSHLLQENVQIAQKYITGGDIAEKTYAISRFLAKMRRRVSKKI
jgi:hypothetical protein